MKQTKRDRPGDYLTVKDVARGSNVEDHVVRFYARAGLIRPARYAANGYRQFVPFDVKRVRFVRAAQSLGFTLAEIREILRRSRLRQTPCPLVRDILARRLIEAADRLRELQAMYTRMQHASELWQHMPECVPTEHDICTLIESVVEDATNPASDASPGA